MWTKRPKPGGKGLRCNIYVGRKGEAVLCGRPARRYGCSKYGLDLGTIDCCVNHRAMYERQRITLTLIDRRKRVAA